LLLHNDDVDKDIPIRSREGKNRKSRGMDFEKKKKKKKKNRYHVEGTELNFIKREKRYMSVHIFKKGGG